LVLSSHDLDEQCTDVFTVMLLKVRQHVQTNLWCCLGCKGRTIYIFHAIAKKRKVLNICMYKKTFSVMNFYPFFDITEKPDFKAFPLKKALNADQEQEKRQNAIITKKNVVNFSKYQLADICISSIF